MVGKKIIVLILLLAFLVPLQYIVLSAVHPQGLAFNGMGEDDALILTSIKYAEFGFKGPWIVESDGIDANVFLNPGNGPLLITTAMSPFYFVLGTDPLAIFVVYKFLAAVFALSMVFYLSKLLIGGEKIQRVAFLVFALSAGFGGVIYLVFKLLTGTADILYPFTLFGFGIGSFRILDFYQSFPFGLSVLSLVCFIKKGYLASGLVLALNVLFYPVYAFGALVSLLVYRFVCLKTGSRIMLKVLVPPVVAGVFWVYAYLRQPLFFGVYSNTVFTVNTNIMLSIVLSLGLPLLFLVYSVHKQNRIKFTIKNKLHLATLWLAGLLLISLSEVSQSYWTTTGSLKGFFQNPDIAGILSFVNTYSFAFDALFLLLVIISTVDAVRSRGLENKYRFVLLWFLAMLFIIAFPTKINALIQPKIVGLIAPPVALLAADGLVKFSRARKINIAKMAALVFIVSLPSLFLYYSFNLSYAYDVYNPDGTLKSKSFYYTEADRTAMLFLRTLPEGNVVATGESGVYLPYYSHKHTLLLGVDRIDNLVRLEEKKQDVGVFYTSRSRDAMLAVIKKYNISYVYQGTFERQKFNSNLDSFDFLEKIYSEDGVSVYSVLD